MIGEGMDFDAGPSEHPELPGWTMLSKELRGLLYGMVCDLKRFSEMEEERSIETEALGLIEALLLEGVIEFQSNQDSSAYFRKIMRSYPKRLGGGGI